MRLFELNIEEECLRFEFEECPFEAIGVVLIVCANVDAEAKARQGVEHRSRCVVADAMSQRRFMDWRDDLTWDIAIFVGSMPHNVFSGYLFSVHCPKYPNLFHIYQEVVMEAIGVSCSPTTNW